MLSLRIKIGVAAIAFAACVSTAFAQPLAVFEEERLAYRMSIMDLLYQGQFGQLESIAQSLRSQRTRFSSGAPVLFDFYAGLNPTEKHVELTKRKALIDQLMKWKQEQPTSIILHVALVGLHMGLAWEARGDTWAKDVNPEGWKFFKEELQIAWHIGNEALQLHPVDPVIYDVLLAVGIGLSLPRQQLDELFSKGISLDPEYEHLYVVMARNLMPRWHGSAEELEAFAISAAQRTEKTLGDGLYARIAAEGLALYGGGDFEELKPVFPWQRLRKGLEDLDMAYPNSSFILNTFCFLAVRYGDFSTARDLFGRLEGHWSKDSQEVWGNRTSFEQAHQRVLRSAAEGGP